MSPLQIDGSDPEMDAFDVLRRVSMSMIALGHDRLGVRMLNTLRSQIGNPQDIEASIALAELARGDIERARQRIEQDVLADQPAHCMALLVRAICDHADGRAYWKRGPQAVLATTNNPQWRQIAFNMLSADH
jgi:hypothetical protein